MDPKSTRRTVLQFAGGAALGTMFTPVPWRVISGAALRSQTWPGVPVPARGPVQAKFTNCALCPAGCAVRARCVGEQPVQLAGVATHPLTRGAMCPFGLAAHHLPYHPERLRQGPVDEAARALEQAIAQCGPGEIVALLDLQPGRTASWSYRRAMAALPHGKYLTAPAPFGGALAVNLSRAKTVLSFGTPLLDGWGTPGSVWAARSAFHLIQAEAGETRTAIMADEWLPIRPGTQAIVAAAIANVLIREKAAGRVPSGMAELATGMPPAKAAPLAGIGEQQIVALARRLAAEGPALVLDGDPAAAPEEAATVIALNQMLGSFGVTLVDRAEAPVPEVWREAPAATALAAVPGRSIRALLIDESAPGGYVPWSAIEPKLAKDALVITFAWSGGGYGRHARYTLPVAVPGEVAADVPPAIDTVEAVFRLSVPLTAPPAGIVDPAAFVSKLSGDALTERAAAIHKASRGTVFTPADGASTPLKSMSAENFEKSLRAGATWIGEAAASKPAPVFAAFAAPLPGADELPLVAIAREMQTAAAPVSPIMTKLYQESNLRLAPRRAALHPDTARACGVAAGAQAVLRTHLGTARITVALDRGVPPGVVEVGAAPGILDVCGARARAQMVPA